MAAEVITTDDLREFRMELLDELQTFVKQIAQKPTKRTLANLRVNGTLKYSKLGGIILYDYDHIVSVIESNQVDNSNYR